MKNPLILLTLFVLGNLSLQAKKAESCWYINLEGDTISYTLVSKGKKWEMERQSFRTVFIREEDANQKQLLPQDIKGYFDGKYFYRSGRTGYLAAGSQQHFFLRELVTGKAELLYYEGDAFQSGPIYLFRQQGEKHFHYVKKATVKNTIGSNSGGGGGGGNGNNGSTGGNGPTTIYIKEFEDEAPFLKFFGNYLGACPKISRKIDQGWYSMSSLEAMFKDFNSCETP